MIFLGFAPLPLLYVQLFPLLGGEGLVMPTAHELLVLTGLGVLSGAGGVAALRVGDRRRAR